MAEKRDILAEVEIFTAELNRLSMLFNEAIQCRDDAKRESLRQTWKQNTWRIKTRLHAISVEYPRRARRL